jgi:hypothetical protein
MIQIDNKKSNHGFLFVPLYLCDEDCIMASRCWMFGMAWKNNSDQKRKTCLIFPRKFDAKFGGDSIVQLSKSISPRNFARRWTHLYSPRLCFKLIFLNIFEKKVKAETQHNNANTKSIGATFRLRTTKPPTA